MEPALIGHTTIPSEWPLNTGSTVQSNAICIRTGQLNCSRFKFNRYLREEFRSLSGAFRVLWANGHWARIDCTSKSNKSCLTIHPKVCSKVAQKLPPKFKKVAYFWKSFCSRLLLKTWRCICNLLAVQKVAENTKSCSKVAEHNLLIPNDHSVIFLFQWIMYWTFLSIHSRSFLEADYLGLLIPEWNIFGIHLRIFKNWIIG